MKINIIYECEICGKIIIKSTIKRSDNINKKVRLLVGCNEYCTRLRRMIKNYKTNKYLYDKYNIYDPTYWLLYFNRNPKNTIEFINKLNLISKYFKPNNNMFLENIFDKCKIPKKEFLEFIYRVKNNYIDFEKLKKFNNANSINRWLVLGFSKDTSEKISNYFRTNEESFILRNKDKTDYKQWKNKALKNRGQNDKNKSVFCKEYWLNQGYNIDEVTEILKNNNRRDLDYFINKYGINDGTKKYYNMCEKRKYSSSLEGYIDKYGKEKGKEKYKEIGKKRSISLEKQIERYGLYEGIQRHNKRISTMLKTLNKNLHNKSKISDLFLDSLEPGIGSNINREVVIGKYICDGFLNNKKLIIEFFGDWWHKNPFIYDINENINIIDHDKKKIEFYKKDYNVIIVWESCVKKFDHLLSIISNYILLEEYNFQINLNCGEFVIDSI